MVGLGLSEEWLKPPSISVGAPVMKESLLLINSLYFLFGATMYMGTMWV